MPIGRCLQGAFYPFYEEREYYFLMRKLNVPDRHTSISQEFCRWPLVAQAVKNVLDPS